MKKILSLVLAMITVLSCSTGVFALSNDKSVNEEAGLFYLYTNGISSTISISSKTATCISTVVGQSGVTTKIVITQKLQKKSGDTWVDVQSWTKTFNQTSAVYVNTKSSLASGTYRTRTGARVYKGTAYETIKVNSQTETC